MELSEAIYKWLTKLFNKSKQEIDQAWSFLIRH